jgi:hypothetical protein
VVFFVGNNRGGFPEASRVFGRNLADNFQRKGAKAQRFSNFLPPDLSATVWRAQTATRR